MDHDRAWLRHAVATLAYRGGKVLRDSPESIAEVRVCPTCRSTIEILAHINDLLDWAHSMAVGVEAWNTSNPMSWEHELERFYKGLQSLDEAIASPEPLHAPAMRLFHGPLADALTHVGQLATLRRLAGSPVRGENYFEAEIKAGQVGVVQPTPRFEFD